jgi:hypothetical protein
VFAFPQHRFCGLHRTLLESIGILHTPDIFLLEFFPFKIRLVVPMVSQESSMCIPIFRGMKANLAFVPIEEGACPCSRCLVTEMKALVDEEVSLDEQLIAEVLKQ